VIDRFRFLADTGAVGGCSMVHGQQLSIVYTTMATMQEAETVAEQAVTEKYAACVNIVPGAVSVYEWEGKLARSQECLLLFKTTITNVEKLKQWIIEKHPYAVPALLSSSIDTSPDFYTYVVSCVSAFNAGTA
jgi:periplasmic divalent cation tolerance protein